MWSRWDNEPTYACLTRSIIGFFTDKKKYIEVFLKLRHIKSKLKDWREEHQEPESSYWMNEVFVHPPAHNPQNTKQIINKNKLLAII